MSDVEMNTEPRVEGTGEGGARGGRPHWMKNKLSGVQKILSDKERRRRENENLIRLLTPKNALMVLDEIIQKEQLATNFKVERAGSRHKFCADLRLDGNIYKGYGENKLSARNAAAEKAIQDLIIKRMSKVCANDVASNADTENTGGENANGESDDSLPMIQLASFALHKLFSKWQYEPKSTGQQNTSTSESMESITPTPAKKRKELPSNAAVVHPCWLLTYMRPELEYRELAVTGDKPQAMLYTMGVDVDGATYIGKASNKKNARREAAKAVCSALFNVSYPDAPPAPVLGSERTPQRAAPSPHSIQ